MGIDKFELGAGFSPFECDQGNRRFAVAREPGAPCSEIPGLLRDESDPIFRLGAFEEHVTVLRMAGGECLSPRVRRIKCGGGVGVAGLV